MAAWRSPESLLERFLQPLVTSWKPLAPLLQSLGALLEATSSQIAASIAGLRGPKAPKMEPKRVSNQVPTASRAGKCKITKLAHSTKDLLDFCSPGVFFMRLKCVKNELRAASSTLEASGSLLKASWNALRRSPKASGRPLGPDPPDTQRFPWIQARTRS